MFRHMPVCPGTCETPELRTDETEILAGHLVFFVMRKESNGGYQSKILCDVSPSFHVVLLCTKQASTSPNTMSIGGELSGESRHSNQVVTNERT